MDLKTTEMEKAQTSLSDYQAFAQEKFAALESQLEAQAVVHKRTLDSYRLEIDNKLSQKQQQLDEAEQRELKLKERFNLLAISEQELREKFTSSKIAYAARFQAATEREHDLNERVQALTKELNELRASNENRERELRDKLNLSQDEISVLRSSQHSFNESLDRSSGISSPRNSSMSELARLKGEADSLHCVLELKQKEISKLTKHNEELMRDAEERVVLQSKISLLESNNEMLKSELDIKSEKEKDFLRKINDKTKEQKESWRATTGREDVNRYFIPRESPHFGGSREEGYLFTDERMDLEPPDEEPNEDKTIKVVDDGAMTMEDAVLNPKAKKKKRMACLPIKHIQQLPKGECSEEVNTKLQKKKCHIKGGHRNGEHDLNERVQALPKGNSMSLEASNENRGNGELR
ncbi:glial fibrillary acidic protein-like [Bactrocera dorsalis]|uniref:Glial fibrillary acidic protein-like n=1 Tax=Bactrocera dorsalis TaxID=27457 RepID=A0ABM3JHB1_BACDO|nr:glial fibrillary acidic protein-like [Bactrocera dorsalis]